MPLGRVVPWISWDEWHEARTGLFSDKIQEMKTAINRVNAWEARGRVPLGADITARLQEVRLRDNATVDKGSSSPVATGEAEALLRLQYAMLVIRLVNGISDSAQKGRMAMSVAHLAEDAGLPRILVDVRHEASHNELPSLALLRVAAAAALEWLSTAYWQRQADHLVASRAHISSILQRYIQLQQAAALKPSSAAADSEADEDAQSSQGDPVLRGSRDAEYIGAVGQKQRRELMAELSEKVQATAHLLVPPLLDDGHLDVSSMPDVSDGDKKRPDPEQAAAAFWEATMQALSANWPVLRQLLLSGAVQRIAQPFLRGPLEPQSGATPEFSGASATVEQSSSGSLSSLEVWIRRLLGVAERGVGPKRRKQQKAGSKRKSGAAKPEGRPPWKPSQQQLTALLATCLRALSKGAAFVDAFPQSEERLAVLRSVFAILTDQAGSVADTVDSGLQSRVQKLAELSGAFGPAETECGSDSIIEGISQMQQAANEAEASHAKLMDRLRQSQQARPQAQKKQRWRLAEDWTPCALGMLPSPHSPGGRLPPLVLPPQAPSSPEEQRGEGTADAAQKPLPDRAASGRDGDGAGNPSVSAGDAAAAALGILPPDEEEWQDGEEEEEDYFSKFESGPQLQIEEHSIAVPPGLSDDQIATISSLVKVL